MSFLFLSHSNIQDKVAEAVRDVLVADGHQSIFLDHHNLDGIGGGEVWEERLYTELRRCRALVALLSPESLQSPWCVAEITHSQALRKTIIPVQIAEIERATFDRHAPPVLRRLQFINWRDANAQSRLLEALRRAGLDSKNLFEWDGVRDPYPGLSAYQHLDSAVYFGREQDVTDLLATVNACRAPGRPRMVIVQGASGTGKSSLVRAGLLPRLERFPEHWLIVPPFRPSLDPFRELAAAFELAANGHLLPSHPRAADALADAGLWAAWILSAADLLRQSRRQNDCTILITIDQMEEVFWSGSKGNRFLPVLRDALDASDFRLLAVATLRSDFAAALQNSTALRDPAPSNENLTTQTHQLGAMRRASYYSVILGPADAAKIEIDPAFVSRLVNDVKTEDALPLMAFVLNKLWERQGRAKREMTLAEYETIGGLEGAVGGYAEKVFEDLRPGDAETGAFRSMLLYAMTDITSDGRVLRRAIPREHVPEKAVRLVDAFIASRLLTASKGGIEISHEAIYQHWPTLAHWLAEATDDLRAKQRVEAAFRSYCDETQDKTSRLLASGRPLEEARDLLQRPEVLNNPDLINFVQDSIKTGDARIRDEARRRRLQSQIVAAAVVTLLFALAAGIFGLSQRAVSISRRYAALSATIERRDSPSSRLFAAMAVATAWPWGHALDPEVEQQLHSALLTSREYFSVSGSAVVSPDGTRLAVLKTDGSVQIIDMRTRQILLNWSGFDSPVRGLAWSPDGLRVAISRENGLVSVRELSGQAELLVNGIRGHVSARAWSSRGLIAIDKTDGPAEVWDTITGRKVDISHDSTFPAFNLVWDPKGTRLAGSTQDATVVVWDVASKKVSVTVSKVDEDDVASGIAWSPDGLSLATTSIWMEIATRVWDADSGAMELNLTHRCDGPNCGDLSIAWSPDGSQLISGGADGIARVRDAKSGAYRFQLTSYGGAMVGVAWSKGGTLATESQDGIATIWFEDPLSRLIAIRGNGAAWSADDTTLSTPDELGNVRFWNPKNGQLVRELPPGGGADCNWSPNFVNCVNKDGAIRPQGTVPSLSWTGETRAIVWQPGGKRLARLRTGAEKNADKEVELWNTETGRREAVLNSPNEGVKRISWSPDGTKLAVTSRQGPQGEGYDLNYVEVWDTASKAELREMQFGEPGSDTEPLWSPNAKRLATAAGNTVTVWDVEDGKDTSRLIGGSEELRPLTWSADSQRLVTGSLDGATVWDADSGSIVFTLSNHNIADGAAWSHDGKLLALAGGGVVRIYDVDIFAVMELEKGLPTPSKGCERYLGKGKDVCPAFPTLGWWPRR